MHRNTTEDEVSFFCFKDITPGTTLDITDSGYVSRTQGFGAIPKAPRAVRTGPTIPAGQAITFGFLSNGTHSSVSPDGLWTFSSLNGFPVWNLNAGGSDLLHAGRHLERIPVSRTTRPIRVEILFGFSTNGQWLPLMTSTSHSGLPLQMECAAWPPRVPRTMPDWLLAPIMPFTTNIFTPGLWTGAKGTDWFDCRNWDDARVPIASTDVEINQTRLNQCFVDGGGTAVCNDLLVSTNSVNTDLFVTNGSTLNCSGDATVQRTAGFGTMGIHVVNGSTFTANNLTLIGPSPITPEGIFQNTEPANTCILSGDLTIQTGGFLDLTMAPAARCSSRGIGTIWPAI
ncbi:MAG: hypothetical protein IPI07_05750 [Flavobacteriales bacterium]|nr:hypothetical protein [Flavobacteriales bacterium]